MSEQDNENDELEGGGGRGKAYPAISLEKAIARADAIREAGFVRTALPDSGFLKIWGFKGASGPSRRVLAALNHYGLLESVGKGKERKLKLSELALRILLDKVPNSPARAAALKDAALAPEIFQKLLEQFPYGVGTDQGIDTFLTLTCGYLDEPAKLVKAAWKDTLAYAGLDKPDNLTAKSTVKGDPSQANLTEKMKQHQDVAVGDLVQVEIGGALQLEKPVFVRAVQEHEGQKWVFVEGSETGIPMEQVTIEQKGQGQAATKTPPTLALPKEEPVRPGARKEVFALDEGDVVLTFPENLSAASFHDLEGYLRLFLRKAQRRAGAGDYFAEVYAHDGTTTKEVQYFDSFPPLLEFMEAFKIRKSKDILRVHLPARASNEERQLATDAGGTLIL